MGFVERSIAAGPFGGDASLTRTVVESFFSLLSRKGFREVGLSGAVVGCRLKPVVTGDGKLFAGEAVRLRKGLLEGSAVASPGEGCLPGSGDVVSVLATLTCVTQKKEVFVADEGDETSAMMVSWTG